MSAPNESKADQNEKRRCAKLLTSALSTFAKQKQELKKKERATKQLMCLDGVRLCEESFAARIVQILLEAVGKDIKTNQEAIDALTQELKALELKAKPKGLRIVKKGAQK